MSDATAYMIAAGVGLLILLWVAWGRIPESWRRRVGLVVGSVAGILVALGAFLWRPRERPSARPTEDPEIQRRRLQAAEDRGVAAEVSAQAEADRREALEAVDRLTTQGPQAIAAEWNRRHRDG